MKAGTVPQERKGERFQPLAAGVPRETLATTGDGRSSGAATPPPGGFPGRLAPSDRTERPAWNRRTAAGSRLAAAAAGQEPAKGKLEAGLLFSVGPGGFVYLGAERLTTRPGDGSVRADKRAQLILEFK